MVGHTSLLAGWRVAAAHDGHRLEQFMRSKGPLRHQKMVTRFHRADQGDEFGARDALPACRKSVASMAEMQRACAFEAMYLVGRAGAYPTGAVNP
ncbi:hypothetical protein ACQEVS_01030 [Streptomyces sp. CA-181903]|uniref:hypothetical protein n=1 Tax=Streptomyces sp. CA-181903 TaxID=3240055 RepID=UPI003D8FB980